MTKFYWVVRNPLPGTLLGCGNHLFILNACIICPLAPPYWPHHNALTWWGELFIPPFFCSCCFLCLERPLLPNLFLNSEIPTYFPVNSAGKTFPSIFLARKLEPLLPVNPSMSYTYSFFYFVNFLRSRKMSYLFFVSSLEQGLVHSKQVINVWLVRIGRRTFG